MGVILKAALLALRCCATHHKRQPVDAFDADALTDVCPLLAPSLPELALKPDLPERPAGRDDLGVLSDHRLRSRFRFPAPRQAQAPSELARLDRDTAEDREQAPGPGQEDESEHDRNCQRHRVSISPSLT